MNKLPILLAVSLTSFASILFTPKGTNYWTYFLVSGIVFFLVWLIKKE